jgi:hypothetical protein
MSNVETTLKGIRALGQSTEFTWAQKKALQQDLLKAIPQNEAFLCVECKSAYPRHTHTCALRPDED